MTRRKPPARNRSPYPPSDLKEALAALLKVKPKPKEEEKPKEDQKEKPDD